MNHFYHNIEGWSSEHDQGNLIKTILQENTSNNLKIAEVGVYHGRGTAIWNVELVNANIQYKYWAIDHFLGSAEHNITESFYETAKNNLQPILSDNIVLVNNNSIDASTMFNDEFFDIIYIDASHDYDNVLSDITAWHKKLKKGGFICGDDYTTGWPGVIQAVDEYFGKDNIRVIGNQQWLVSSK
jgi:predicted O-methyltransferase YrrM